MIAVYKKEVVGPADDNKQLMKMLEQRMFICLGISWPVIIAPCGGSSCLLLLVAVVGFKLC